jgi:Na+/H+-dicarboxylate symporter
MAPERSVRPSGIISRGTRFCTQVLIAIALGVVSDIYPFGKQLKPLGDAFIALIKMMIAPVIFCTVVHGISSMAI